MEWGAYRQSRRPDTLPSIDDVDRGVDTKFSRLVSHGEMRSVELFAIGYQHSTDSRRVNRSERPRPITRKELVELRLKRFLRSPEFFAVKPPASYLKITIPHFQFYNILAICSFQAPHTVRGHETVYCLSVPSLTIRPWINKSSFFIWLKYYRKFENNYTNMAPLGVLYTNERSFSDGTALNA